MVFIEQAPNFEQQAQNDSIFYKKPSKRPSTKSFLTFGHMIVLNVANKLPSRVLEINEPL